MCYHVFFDIFYTMRGARISYDRNKIVHVRPCVTSVSNSEYHLVEDSSAASYYVVAVVATCTTRSGGKVGRYYGVLEEVSLTQEGCR